MVQAALPFVRYVMYLCIYVLNDVIPPVEKCDLIQLRLAGVSPYPASEQWLQQRLCGRKVTFVPLSLCGDHLYSTLYTRVSLLLYL